MMTIIIILTIIINNDDNDDNNLQAFQLIIARHLLGAFHRCDTTAKPELKGAKDCSDLMYAITAVRCKCIQPYLCLSLMLACYCWYTCR